MAERAAGLVWRVLFERGRPKTGDRVNIDRVARARQRANDHLTADADVSCAGRRLPIFRNIGYRVVYLPVCGKAGRAAARAEAERAIASNLGGKSVIVSLHDVLNGGEVLR